MTTATIHAPTTEAELSEIILAASGPISVRGGATGMYRVQEHR